jgi:hypothetical protein
MLTFLDIRPKKEERRIVAEEMKAELIYTRTS